GEFRAAASRTRACHRRLYGTGATAHRVWPFRRPLRPTDCRGGRARSQPAGRELRSSPDRPRRPRRPVPERGLDESDAELSAFPSARDLGYTGVSSKCCKGLYKSVLNAARCRMCNAEAGGERYFMSGEDLTTQAGLAVQQDL